jgi:hypothetical protein
MKSVDVCQITKKFNLIKVLVAKFTIGFYSRKKRFFSMVK